MTSQRIRPKRMRWGSMGFALLDTAQELLNNPEYGESNKAIAQALSNDDRFDVTVADRTVAEWRAKRWIVIDDRFAPWSMLDASADEARLLMPVVAFLISQTSIPTQRPTKVMAERLVKLLTVDPDLNPGRALELAFALGNPDNVQAGRGRNSPATVEIDQEASQ